MCCEGAALTVGTVGRRAVQRLTVVEHSASCRQIDDDGFDPSDSVGSVEQDIAAFMTVGGYMRARDQVHGAIGDIYIIQREPAADQVGRSALPVAVVLVPVDGAAVVGGLEEGLIVEQLDTGSDEVFGDVEDVFVVNQPPVDDAALAHLHDLQHFFVGTLVVALRCPAIGRQIAVAVAVAGLVEEAVILLPQRLYLAVFQQLANDDEAVAPEGVDLVLGQGAVGVFGGWLVPDEGGR